MTIGDNAPLSAEELAEARRDAGDPYGAFTTADVLRLLATITARDAEIARLTGTLDGPREAMKANRDHWRQRCEQLEKALKHLAGRDTFGVNPDGTYIKSQQWAREQLAAILAGGVR